MNSDAIRERFDDLSIWKQGDERAPHKPLLILYALGRWQAGHKDVTFRQVEPDLASLLREFGPPRKSVHPDQPFWRLQRAGVWTVHAPADLPLKTGDDLPRITALRSHDVRAEFPTDVQAALAVERMAKQVERQNDAAIRQFEQAAQDLNALSTRLAALAAI
jgi:putative restriction endonuclease